MTKHTKLDRLAHHKHGPAWKAWRSVALGHAFDLDLLPDMLSALVSVSNMPGEAVVSALDESLHAIRFRRDDAPDAVQVYVMWRQAMTSVYGGFLDGTDSESLSEIMRRRSRGKHGEGWRSWRDALRGWRVDMRQIQAMISVAPTMPVETMRAIMIPIVAISEENHKKVRSVPALDLDRIEEMWKIELAFRESGR